MALTAAATDGAIPGLVDVAYDSGGRIAPKLADDVGNGGWIGAGACWLLLLTLLARAYVVGRRTQTVAARPPGRST